MMLLAICVFPDCAAHIRTIVVTEGSEKASIGPGSIQLGLCTTLPGSALSSGLNLRYRSAHSLTVSLGGDFHRLIAP
jgi:hypothetical protein